MQKFAIYAIVAIIFAVFGFSFARYCPLASPKKAGASQTTDPAAEIQAAKSVGVLTNQLNTARSQLALYKLQHNDNFPDFRKFGWKQLTFKTNNSGQITGNDRAGNPLYGPYFLSPPANPLTKSSEVFVVATLPDNFKAEGTYGFVFEESTGKFLALTSDGKIFDESSSTASAR